MLKQYINPINHKQNKLIFEIVNIVYAHFHLIQLLQKFYPLLSNQIH